jgi:hypothetical protein
MVAAGQQLAVASGEFKVMERTRLTLIRSTIATSLYRREPVFIWHTATNNAHPGEGAGAVPPRSAAAVASQECRPYPDGVT